jgi:hypothetical protein
MNYNPNATHEKKRLIVAEAAALLTELISDSRLKINWIRASALKYDS